MNFGQAIEEMKSGNAVARKGWNGKGMFVYLVSGSSVDASRLRSQAYKHVGSKRPEDHKVTINPHIDMKAADGTIVPGWLASQTDMLSEDWLVV